MAKKGNASVPFDAIGGDLAKVLDIKRRLIESGIRLGNLEYARGILDDVRDRSLEDMTPKETQQAIYGWQIFEESLRVDYPELCH